jgi:hypothetical protein
MRTRSTVVAAVAAGLIMTVIGPALAAKPVVLDGKKKTKVVSITQTPSVASNFVPGDPTDAQVLACKEKTQCDRLDFVYAPAKGVKGDMTVFSKWYFPTTTNVDLYLVSGSKILASCTGNIGNERYIQVPAKTLKSGGVYTAIAYTTRSTGEGLTLEAAMPSVQIAQFTKEDMYNYRLAACQ